MPPSQEPHRHRAIDCARSGLHERFVPFSVLQALFAVPILLLLPIVLRAQSFSLQRQYLGEALFDQFGYALHAAGDVNGDGFADFLAAANVSDAGAPGGGKVYLYLGGSDYPTGPFIQRAGFIAKGSLGAAVCGGGDLNGDGYDDWAVGAPGLGASGSDPGRCYVFLGGATPDAEPDLVIVGGVPGGQFGSAVLVGADLDGDGFSELIVGAPRAGDGEIRLYRGGRLPLDPEPDRIVHARAIDSRYGRSLAWLPDADGDRCDDLLVGVPHNSETAAWAGAVILYRGTATLDTIPDRVLLGLAAGDEFGTSITAGADVDGDGAADIVVGAPMANVGSATDAGTAYLYRGSSVLDTVVDRVFLGNHAGDRMGTAVSCGFDWNGDGAQDLAVGVPGADDSGTDSGSCWIYRGGVALDALRDDVVTGSGTGVQLGMSVASLGEVRRNSHGALLVGGYGSADAGRALLFASSTPTDVASETWRPRRAQLAAWPNPARSMVSTRLESSRPAHWTLEVYDVRGRLVVQLFSGSLGAGAHVLVWDGRDRSGATVPAGVYCVRGRSEDQTESTSVVLAR